MIAYHPALLFWDGKKANFGAGRGRNVGIGSFPLWEQAAVFIMHLPAPDDSVIYDRSCLPFWEDLRIWFNSTSRDRNGIHAFWRMRRKITINTMIFI